MSLPDNNERWRETADEATRRQYPNEYWWSLTMAGCSTFGPSRPSAATSTSPTPASRIAREKRGGSHPCRRTTQFTSYPPVLRDKVNELVAALPEGDEERDKLIAEMRAPQSNPPLLMQILQFISVQAGEEIVKILAREAMEALSEWMSG
jgi:hypothetical protein